MNPNELTPAEREALMTIHRTGQTTEIETRVIVALERHGLIEWEYGTTKLTPGTFGRLLLPVALKAEEFAKLVQA